MWWYWHFCDVVIERVANWLLFMPVIPLPMSFNIFFVDNMILSQLLIGSGSWRRANKHLEYMKMEEAHKRNHT